MLRRSCWKGRGFQVPKELRAEYFRALAAMRLDAPSRLERTLAEMYQSTEGLMYEDFNHFNSMIDELLRRDGLENENDDVKFVMWYRHATIDGLTLRHWPMPPNLMLKVTVPIVLLEE